MASFFSAQVLAQGDGDRDRERERERPNFVVIFLDDAAWNDFEPFGDPPYSTPSVARLAREGRQFHRFYVPQAICSASRAALLTGCYPGRTRVFGAHAPRERGLDPKYATLAEVLKARGYRTGVFGKWHLGDQEDTRPPARGFDESAGLMYSNDMWQDHPENPEFWGRHPLQYWDDGRVTIEPVTGAHQKQLTRWATERATRFIERHRESPFFLYVPHSMPHVPLFCSEAFEGKSGAGLLGDVIMEIGWSVGQILKALRENGVEDNTLVMFTSDNGPWISYGDHAGTTPYREAKATGFDGGTRSPCILKFPGRLEAGSVSNRIVCSIDILPTFARLAGASLPENEIEIDGKDVWDWISGELDATNPHVYYPFSTGSVFEGILSGDGRWKLHRPHAYRTLVTPGGGGLPGKYENRRIGWALFDLAVDPYESTDVHVQYSEVFQFLKALVERHHGTFYAAADGARL